MSMSGLHHSKESDDVPRQHTPTPSSVEVPGVPPLPLSDTDNGKRGSTPAYLVRTSSYQTMVGRFGSFCSFVCWLVSRPVDARAPVYASRRIFVGPHVLNCIEDSGDRRPTKRLYRGRWASEDLQKGCVQDVACSFFVHTVIEMCRGRQMARRATSSSEL